MSGGTIIVYLGRTNTKTVDMGADVSGDTITSEIRASKTDPESELLATWDVDFVTDGEDGMLSITIDDSALGDIEPGTIGWMDFKRVSAGEPLPVIKQPIRVRFKASVTA